MSKDKIREENPFKEIEIFLRGTINEEIYCQLLGKVLTVIDSSIVDEKQNKAVKDLIKGYFAKISWGMIKVLKDCIRKRAEEAGQPIKDNQDKYPSIPIKFN